jgi:hypothetical protein
VYRVKIKIVLIKKVKIMLSNMQVRVGKLYRRLFVNDLKLRITILEERVHELEHINKQRETARQKRYNYKQGKKQNA